MERGGAFGSGWSMSISTRQPLGQQIAPVCLPEDAATQAQPAHMPPSQAHLFAQVIRAEGCPDAPPHQEHDVHKYSFLASPQQHTTPAGVGAHLGGSPGIEALHNSAAQRGAAESEARACVEVRGQLAGKDAGGGQGEVGPAPRLRLPCASDPRPTSADAAADYPSHPDEPRQGSSATVAGQAPVAAQPFHRSPLAVPRDRVLARPGSGSSSGADAGGEESGRAPCAASWVTLEGERGCAHCGSSYVAFGLSAAAGAAAGGGERGAAGGGGERDGWRHLFCATCLRGELDTRCAFSSPLLAVDGSRSPCSASSSQPASSQPVSSQPVSSQPASSLLLSAPPAPPLPLLLLSPSPQRAKRGCGEGARFEPLDPRATGSNALSLPIRLRLGLSYSVAAAFPATLP